MYRNLNDYELLYMISENRSDDFNLLYEKYSPLIYKVAKKYIYTFKKYGYEIEDLLQIGYITLYKASYLYDVYNTSMFYTYFVNALKNAFNSEIKMNKTEKKEALNNALSYDLELPNSDLSYIDVIKNEDDKDKNEDYTNIIIDFKNSMPFDMSCVFELYYNGYNIDEISILLDRDLEDVKKDLKEIKQHGLTYRYLFLN